METIEIIERGNGERRSRSLMREMDPRFNFNEIGKAGVGGGHFSHPIICSVYLSFYFITLSLFRSFPLFF